MTNTLAVFASHEEGCTLDFNLNLIQKAKGFFVALTDNAVKEISFEEIENLKALASKLNVANPFIGYWRDANTGIHYLDLSIHIEDSQTAVQMAKQYNQKAIWDIANSDCIYV